ncbi:hypothetical protein PFISCL1PPCAC_25480, partial [Pristionchus fissidentatus]
IPGGKCEILDGGTGQLDTDLSGLTEGRFFNKTSSNVVGVNDDVGGMLKQESTLSSPKLQPTKRLRQFY